jgi:fructokinase
MTAPRLIVGIGELLWDLLPQGKQLGGAPANFAVMAARLGNHSVIASRVADDALGREASKYLSQLPVDSSFIQMDPEHASGSVSVSINQGQPEYIIHESVAWDFLEFSPEWHALAGRAHAVCFGSLAQRSEVSRQTIQTFLAATFPECVRVFDVNLRAPFYSEEILVESLALATILKMNDGEMPLVLSLLGLAENTGTSEDALLRGAHLLLAKFPINLVCVTMGKSGSLLISRDEVDRHLGISTVVADTIGAGDAFTAALTHYYLQGKPLNVINEAGNRWGAWMASQAGAMPPLPEAVRLAIALEIDEKS